MQLSNVVISSIVNARIGNLSAKALYFYILQCFNDKAEYSIHIFSTNLRKEINSKKKNAK